MDVLDDCINRKFDSIKGGGVGYGYGPRLNGTPASSGKIGGPPGTGKPMMSTTVVKGEGPQRPPSPTLSKELL